MPTKIWEICPIPPTWMDATDDSLKGMTGFFQIPSRQWFVCRLLVITFTAHKLLTNKNPGGYPKINNIELLAYVVHLHIFSLLMATLDYIAKKWITYNPRYGQDEAVSDPPQQWDHSSTRWHVFFV